MKQFVKTLDQGGPCFVYIGRNMPGPSGEQFRAGIFDRLKLR